MISERSRASKTLLGVCLVVCLLFGGGTERGLVVEAALQILTIVCATFVLMYRPWSKSTRLGFVFFVLLFVVGLSQLIPLPSWLLESVRPPVLLPFGEAGSTTILTPISLSVSRTLEATIFALVSILFFSAAASLADDELAGLIPFFMIGIICNLIAALLQYSFSANKTLSDVLGYSTMIGMFANVNHFSTLVFASIPLFVYSAVRLQRPNFSIICLCLLFVILLAAGSRAGILIGIGALFTSIASLLWRGRLSSGITLALVIILAIYGYGALARIGDEGIALDTIRGDVARTTLDAVWDNYLLGVGFGTFDLVYPVYEKADKIMSSYINHAHNDFLEIILEGGLTATALLIAYAVVLSIRWVYIGRAALQRLVVLSIAFISLHSMVDYPLRTMAVAITFAFMNALFFSTIGTNGSRSAHPVTSE